MQLMLLDMMQAIHDVCCEHNLHYYLIAGTMLGAVRHQGFVPWDDDADMALPRPDYDMLVAHANEWLPKRYELVSNVQNPHYPYAFARVQDRETTYILRRKFNFVGGLPVDIFPLDGMTASKLSRRWHYLRYSINNRLMYYNLVDPYKHGRGLRSVYINFFHKVVSSKWIHERMDKVQKQYDYSSSALIADHDNKPSRGILPREVYGKPTLVSFEGHKFYGVQNPNAYLKYCYGDYMKMPGKLPPQNFRYLNMRLPYNEYLKKKK